MKHLIRKSIEFCSVILLTACVTLVTMFILSLLVAIISGNPLGPIFHSTFISVASIIFFLTCLIAYSHILSQKQIYEA